MTQNFYSRSYNAINIPASCYRKKCTTDYTLKLLMGSGVLRPDKGVILLFAGAGVRPEIWRPLTQRLAPFLNVLWVDVDFHQYTKQPLERYIVRQISDWLADLSAPLLWLGHSYGGSFVLEALHGNNIVIDKAILLSSGARMKVSEDLFTLMEGHDRGNWLASLQFTCGQSFPENYWHSVIKSLPACFQAFQRCHRYDRVKKLKPKHRATLIVGGEKDLLTPPRFLYYLQKHMPSSDLHLKSQAGHWLMIEEVHWLAKRIIQFA